jgi:hypothetical protein
MVLEDLPKSVAFYFVYYENTIVLYDSWDIQELQMMTGN